MHCAGWNVPIRRENPQTQMAKLVVRERCQKDALHATRGLAEVRLQTGLGTICHERCIGSAAGAVRPEVLKRKLIAGCIPDTTTCSKPLGESYGDWFDTCCTVPGVFLAESRLAEPWREKI